MVRSGVKRFVLLCLSRQFKEELDNLSILKLESIHRNKIRGKMRIVCMVKLVHCDLSQKAEKYFEK